MPVPLHELQAKATAQWAQGDPVLARLSRANPIPATQVIPGTDGFADLATSIIHQQVSIQAGRTITANVVKLLGGSLTPRRLANRSPEALRSAGLSRAKAAYLLDLADRTLRGEVEFSRFAAMPDDAILQELVAVKGIGAWTAKMFLIFHLQRPDVFAPEDLGLRLAVAQAYGVPPEHATDVMAKLRPAWSPYCSVAARVLWLSRRQPMAEAAKERKEAASARSRATKAPNTSPAKGTGTANGTKRKAVAVVRVKRAKPTKATTKRVRSGAR